MKSMMFETNRSCASIPGSLIQTTKNDQCTQRSKKTIAPSGLQLIKGSCPGKDGFYGMARVGFRIWVAKTAFIGTAYGRGITVT